jgi:HD-GYP domain-containing protein (c-di-GMP phosphodiesterase class II)
VSWRSADELLASPDVGNVPAVLLVDGSMLDRIGDLRNLPRHVILIAADAAADAALGVRAHLSVAGMPDGAGKYRELRAACQFSSARLAASRKKRQLVRAQRDLRELTRSGVALMSERNEAALLKMIVTRGMDLTESDAGCLLLVEADERNVPRLRMTLYETDSLTDLPPMTGATYPIDNATIIGRAVVAKEPVIVPDVYDLPEGVGIAFDPTFDETFGYRIRSMLIVPMVDRLERAAGVLLFVNRKSERSAIIRNKSDADRYVVPYTFREVQVARALASQAAISIENAKLHAQIESMLDSFVKASALAIDQRDPTTAGHSVRVAALVTDLAGAVERQGRGTYRDVRFTRQQMRELHYAALLHDFGKVAVREELLIKAKKLPAALCERVDARFDLIRRTMEVEYYRKCVEMLLRPEASRQIDAAMEAEFVNALEELEALEIAVRAANEPSLEAQRPATALADIARRTFERNDGSVVPYLTTDELRYLELSTGTLNAGERAAVEGHVDATFRFLVGIPWTDDLKNLTTYAYGHHEKLDGSGYPRKLRGEEIPIQTRIMTIADIFDALTASDRPYKAAVDADKALDILHSEAEAGRLDSELIRIMVESQVYRRILQEDWHQL